jgi:hypothetical protein
MSGAALAARSQVARFARARTPGALLACLLLGPGCALFGGDAQEASDEASRRETEEAIAIVERMSAALAALPAFRFEAEVGYDAVQATGQRIEFGSLRRITVRRPDRMRLDVAHWDGDRELIGYDGARIWAAAPTRGVYASVEHAGPIEPMLERLESELGAPTPLVELIDPGLPAKLRAIVEAGARVGGVRFAGRDCEQLAFRAPGLDFQLFVDQGEPPLPRRLVIDYVEEPGRPQFRASLRGWELAPELADEVFGFAPPLGAQRVAFDELVALLVAPPTPEPGAIP